MDKHLVDLDSLAFPVFNYRSYPKSALTPTNLFAMAFGLFMIAAPMMDWISYASPTLGSALCFGGVCEYLIGFYNWFDGRTLQSLIDFAFGLLHLTIYFTSDFGKYSIPVPYEYTSYMQGTFYCLWLAFLMVLLLAMGRRGCFYLVNFFLLCCSCLFALIWHFSKRNWAKKVSGYFLFFACITIFLTGLLHCLNLVFRRTVFNAVNPYP
jgi:hypothetical protein